MEQIILTQLSVPQVRDLLREELEAFFADKPITTQTIRNSDETWFNLQELCDYLPDKPAKPTVYAWVNQGIVPYHKGGKKLRFLKSEIDEWLKQGKQESRSEINKGMDQFLRTHKKKSGGNS